MNKKIGLVLSLLLVLNTAVFGEELTINIKGSTPHQGKVFIAIFNNVKQFPSGTPIKLITQLATIKYYKVNLPKGVYAVAAFQDKNNNNKLDLNFFKMPKEKTGTSGKKYFGKPTFAKAAFELSKNQKININLM